MNEQISKAAEIIIKGGVIVFPTMCLYGLGADAGNISAVKRIFTIKERPPDKPVLILISGKDHLKNLVTHVPDKAALLIERFWPGKLTLVFQASDLGGGELKDILTAGSGKIGIRLAGHPMTAALVKAVGKPITGTSANISGEPGCNDPSDLSRKLIHRVDMLLDGGILIGGAGSTVVDVTGNNPKILREGAVSSEAIFSVLLH